MVDQHLVVEELHDQAIALVDSDAKLVEQGLV
jgi:hypothetical protein